jgi:HD-GYP domain-containing protein (c-di-GMP phosphodiesterase class II)
MNRTSVRMSFSPILVRSGSTRHSLFAQETQTITPKGYDFASFEGLSRLCVKTRVREADLLPVTAAAPATYDDDALVALRRTEERSRLAARTTTGAVTSLFFVVAVGALALPSHASFSLAALLVSLFCYALASRVEFEFGSGWALPTQGVFVAMWFMLPPRILPLVVCAGMLAGALPDLLRRRLPLERLALPVASSWHSVGPALVLYAWGGGAPSWQSVPVYAGALVAQFGLDFAASFLCTRAVVGVTARAHAFSVAPAYAVDVMLAPFGLLVAFEAHGRPWVLLLILPVLLMFSTFAKERQYRIDNALELSTAYRGTAMLLGDVIEADDEYTGSHSRHVVDLVLGVADRLGLDAAQRRRAEFAALLHDVGKVKIPPEIINKPGALDDDEWATMRTHTILGEQMLEQIGGLLGEVGRIVRSCHERWDGNGYPDGLAGEAIPLEARIVCACDAWSAMTTDRSYRAARSHTEALAELRASSGTHFDPRVVAALEAIVSV